MTLVIGACGGGPSTESSLPSLTTLAPTQHASPVPSVSVAPKPSMTPSPSPIASATPTPERPVAGEILAITTQRGYVNEDRANPGDRVRERSEVRTDEQGSLQFDLRNKIQRCTMVNDSRINAKPSDDVLLHFIEGEVFCLTEGDPGVIVLTAGPNAELRMSDPGFLVTVDGDATTVRVARGLVELRSTDTGGTVFLGPKSASTVVPGADPNLPELWAVGDLKDDRMRDEVNGLFNLKPDLSMPRAGDSPTLRRIADTGTIRIGMPEGVSAGDAGRFTKHFFESQGFDWNVADEYPIVESIDAPAAFQQGVVDLLCTRAGR